MQTCSPKAAAAHDDEAYFAAVIVTRVANKGTNACFALPGWFAALVWSSRTGQVPSGREGGRHHHLAQVLSGCDAKKRCRIEAHAKANTPGLPTAN